MTSKVACLKSLLTDLERTSNQEKNKVKIRRTSKRTPIKRKRERQTERNSPPPPKNKKKELATQKVVFFEAVFFFFWEVTE